MVTLTDSTLYNADSQKIAVGGVNYKCSCGCEDFSTSQIVGLYRCVNCLRPQVVQ